LAKGLQAKGPLYIYLTQTFYVPQLIRTSLFKIQFRRPKFFKARKAGTR